MAYYRGESVSAQWLSDTQFRIQVDRNGKVVFSRDVGTEDFVTLIQATALLFPRPTRMTLYYWATRGTKKGKLRVLARQERAGQPTLLVRVGDLIEYAERHGYTRIRPGYTNNPAL